VPQNHNKNGTAKTATNWRQKNGGRQATRCRASLNVFIFSFLLILDEGGLREGWVKSAYSSLAGRQNGGKTAANLRQKTAPNRNHNKKRRQGKMAANQR
jgi:hypothetical protein